MADESVRTDPRPLYLQVQSVIVARILDGTYKPNEKLPPEDVLATQFGVSRTTLRTALGNLETMGYIRRVHGAGTFVAGGGALVETRLETLVSFHPRLAAQMGLSSRLVDLAIERVKASDRVAEHLGVDPETLVTRVCRTVEINGIRVVHLCDYLPETLVTADELRRSFKDSIVDYFDGRGGRPLIAWAQTDLGAVRADQSMAAALAVEPGDILLLLEEAFYSPDNQLISWSTNHIVPEYFRFHVNRQVARDPSSD